MSVMNICWIVSVTWSKCWSKLVKYIWRREWIGLNQRQSAWKAWSGQTISRHKVGATRHGRELKSSIESRNHSNRKNKQRQLLLHTLRSVAFNKMMSIRSCTNASYTTTTTCHLIVLISYITWARKLSHIFALWKLVIQVQCLI